MSAAASLANLGSGTKNLAIGIGILVAVAAVVYVVVKGKQGIAAAGQAVKDAGGYVFGSSNTSTLGTDIYNAFHGATATNPDGTPLWWDTTQAEKTRIALIGQREKTYGVD